MKLQCVKCNRMVPSSRGATIAEALEEFGLNRPQWAKLHHFRGFRVCTGICPDCQTPEERAGLIQADTPATHPTPMQAEKGPFSTPTPRTERPASSGASRKERKMRMELRRYHDGYGAPELRVAVLEQQSYLLEYARQNGDKAAFLNAADTIVKLRRDLEKAQRQARSLPASIQEALNSGDGVYRP